MKDSKNLITLLRMGEKLGEVAGPASGIVKAVFGCCHVLAEAADVSLVFLFSGIKIELVSVNKKAATNQENCRQLASRAIGLSDSIITKVALVKGSLPQSSIDRVEDLSR